LLRKELALTENSAYGLRARIQLIEAYG